MTTIVLYKGVLATDSCNTKTIQHRDFQFSQTNKILTFQNEIYYCNTKVLAMSGAGVENSILRMFNYLSKEPVNLEKHFELISNSLEGDHSSFIFLLEDGKGVFAKEVLNEKGLYKWELEIIDYDTRFCLGSGYDFVNDLELSSATSYCEIACKLDKYSSLPVYFMDSVDNRIERIDNIQKKTLNEYLKLF